MKIFKFLKLKKKTKKVANKKDYEPKMQAWMKDKPLS